MTKRFRRSGTSDKLLNVHVQRTSFFFNVLDSNILSNVIKIVLIHYFSNILKNTYIISHIKKYPIFKTTLY